MEINPTKLIWGNRLYNVIAKNQVVEEVEDLLKALMVSLQDVWFSNIGNLLTYGEFLEGITRK